MGTFVIVHPISTDKNINYKRKTILIAVDIMADLPEDVKANLQDLAHNAKDILKDNFKGGLDNLDVDKLAGQLNDEVNKLNEKLNSGIVPQGNMMTMMVMILMIMFLTKVFLGRSIN